MLCCWSGGCDSTLAVVLAALELGQKEELGQKGKPAHFGQKLGVSGASVRALTVVHPQVGAMVEQGRARCDLLARLRMKYRIDHTTVTMRQKGDFYGTRGSGLAQPLMWLGVALNYIEPEETLVFGYVHGDDFWHHKQEFIAAFDQLQSLAGRTGKLWFPLEWLGKSDVIGELKHLRLYSHCWYCEDPRYRKLKKGQKLGKRECGRPCGKCHPCVTHLTARWQLSSGLVVPDRVATVKKMVKGGLTELPVGLPVETPVETEEKRDIQLDEVVG